MKRRSLYVGFAQISAYDIYVVKGRCLENIAKEFDCRFGNVRAGGNRIRRVIGLGAHSGCVLLMGLLVLRFILVHFCSSYQGAKGSGRRYLGSVLSLWSVPVCLFLVLVFFHTRGVACKLKNVSDSARREERLLIVAKLPVTACSKWQSKE